MSEDEDLVTEVRWGWVVKKDQGSGSMWALMTYRWVNRKEVLQVGNGHWEDHGWLTRMVEITSVYRTDAEGNRDLVSERWDVIDPARIEQSE